MPWEEALLGEWRVTVWLYVPLVIVLSALTRVMVALVRALKPDPNSRWFHRWCNYIRPSPVFDLDPTVLGTLELLAYPVLMKVHAWQVIGSWLAFKTLAQWEAWKRARSEYNLFLIGNALVLILSFVFLAPLVQIVAVKH